MKLLILIVCLIVIQTSPPVPRKTPDGPAKASDGIKSQRQKNQKPTDSIPQINDSIEATAQSPNSNEPEDKNKADQNVRIIEQPLNIAVKKDKIDWSVWAFSFLLVVVGGLQFIVLLRQANISERQADIAEKQKLQMAEAGQQTERIIVQMKESEIRDLRAYVGVSKVILNLQREDIPRGIVEVHNFGKTPAYKVRQWIGIAIHSHPLTIVLPESSRPKVASSSILFPGIKNISLVDLKKPLPPNTVIGTPQLTVYVFGGVVYNDAFGNERHSSYRFIFGGPEGGQLYRDDTGFLFGRMNPDSEGNDAA